MDKYICSCCGGNINRATMTCEYCGTRYEEERGNVVRVETFRNPVQTLQCKVCMDEYLLHENPRGYSEFAIRSLAKNFAELIAPYMDVEYSYDHKQRMGTLYGQVKVVVPVNKPTDFYENFN